MDGADLDDIISDGDLAAHLPLDVSFYARFWGLWLGHRCLQISPPPPLQPPPRPPPERGRELREGEGGWGVEERSEIPQYQREKEKPCLIRPDVIAGADGPRVAVYVCVDGRLGHARINGRRARTQVIVASHWV